MHIKRIRLPRNEVGAGYIIRRNTTFVDFAFFSVLLIGCPTGLLALSCVSIEIANTCGMSHAGLRAMLLKVCVLLMSAVSFLSSLNEGGMSSAVIPFTPYARESLKESAET